MLSSYFYVFLMSGLQFVCVWTFLGWSEFAFQPSYNREAWGKVRHAETSALEAVVVGDVVGIKRECELLYGVVCSYVEGEAGGVVAFEVDV